MSQILNTDYQPLREIAIAAGRSEFVRMMNNIRNDKNHPMHVPLMGLLIKSTRNLNIFPKLIYTGVY